MLELKPLLDALKQAAPGNKTLSPLVAPDLTHDDQNKVIGFSRRTATSWSAPELLKIIGFAHQLGFWWAVTGMDYFLGYVDTMASQTPSRFRQ